MSQAASGLFSSYRKHTMKLQDKVCIVTGAASAIATWAVLRFAPATA
jgi:hypothetical protein